LPLGAILLLALLPALPASARVSHNDSWAHEKFAAAERMREALNGRPAAERTRNDYQRVVDAYRRVYFGAPASTKADASVVAVAELQVEIGRRFDEAKILQAAVRQYEFLRKQYPGSKYRFDALFTIGEIYKDDLDDPEEAKATFEEFLRRYPHNRLVREARDAIAEINNRAQNLDREPARNDAAKREAEKYQAAEHSPRKSERSHDDSARLDDQWDTSPSQAAGQAEIKSAGNTEDTGDESSSDEDASSSASHKYARVTMIRHWSTPDYTRVAIDLEQDVKFGAQRIGDPDRIFFDLYNTKLASTLVGKSFEVDDGFLKKIRVAQFKPGLTRVVLEVDQLSEYDAFLLPNPTRLIIDVHGKKSERALARGAKPAEIEPTAESEAKPSESTAAETKLEERDIAAVRPAEHPTREPKVEVAKATASAPAASEASVSDAAATDVTSSAPKHARAVVPKPPSDSAASIPPNARKVPRKIVEADDDEELASEPPSKARQTASLRVEDLRPDLAPASSSTKTEAPAVPAVAPDGVPADDNAAPKKFPSARSKSKRKSAPTTADIDVREAQPTASGDRSLIRALGLKIGKIVIDPGHGGHDTGTIGPDGLEEKDLVLDVGRRLGKLLETRLGAEVVYTRKDDTFIPLETRTAIANQEQADLFVSIHANSSHDPSARGVETYYLNFTSNADALEVAARENAVSAKSIHELGDLVKKIALKEKIEESHEFASDVQQALHSGLASKNPGIRDRGVKKAPFIVLIGANMPSILAEISFVSNPADERRLQTPEYRQRIAESLYRGIQKYVSGLSGVKVATKLAKSEGQ
jgi:N-acetylmuramoyl-L-alanine amidase